MKKYAFSLIVSAMLIVAGCNTNNNNKQTDIKGPVENNVADNVKYTCPMHPEVVSDHPGNCPKCGMELVKIDKNADSTSHMRRDTV